MCALYECCCFCLLLPVLLLLPAIVVGKANELWQVEVVAAEEEAEAEAVSQLESVCFVAFLLLHALIL